MIRAFGAMDKTFTSNGDERLAITRDADGGYVLTPVEAETEPTETTEGE